MAETKLEAWRRLEAEGRYDEFRERRTEIRKSRGVSKDEAHELALEEFAPIDHARPENVGDYEMAYCRECGAGRRNRPPSSGSKCGVG